MKDEDARILVLSAVAADAQVFTDLLAADYPGVRIETDEQLYRATCERLAPHVLILAFRSVADAESRYRGMFRGPDGIVPAPHRTLLLCSKDDVREAYESCRANVFDDYILFWPMAFDATRLAMSVHQALRFVHVHAAAATLPELNLHARQVAALGESLDDALDTGREHLQHIRDAFDDVGERVRSSLGELGRRMMDNGLDAAITVHDAARVREQLDALEREGITPPLASAVASLEPVAEWIAALPGNFEEPLRAVKAFGRHVENRAPLLLVVDDDDFMRKLLVRLLATGGFTVGAVSSGAEAIAYLRTQHPDLVLMDVRLPDVDGITLTKQLKRIDAYARIPIIMLTGMGQKEVLYDSRRAGAADFVVKPFDRETLLGKVSRHLSMRPSDGLHVPARH